MFLIDGVYTDLEKPLLYIHILAGFVSLGTAYLLLFLKKGDKRHKKYGMYYVYGMSTIFVTAIPLSMMGVVQPFLFAIAIFSFYFAFAGYRQAKIRTGARENVDKALTLLMFIAGVLLFLNAAGLINYGFYGQFEGMNTISIIFGIGCMYITAYDLNRYRKTDKPNFYDRTNTHLNLMLAGTIAATTAFISTIELFPQEWMNWAMPNVFIVPVIVYFSRRELAKKTT